MNKISLTEAAKRTKTGRNTLYRAIAAGRLQRDADGALDTAELRRAGFTLLQAEPAANAPERTAVHEDTSRVSHHVEQMLAAMEHERTCWERERALLQDALAAARAREQQLLTLLRELTHELPPRQVQREVEATPVRGEKRRRWWRR